VADLPKKNRRGVDAEDPEVAPQAVQEILQALRNITEET
jgi:hypothetical protein